MLRFLFLFSRLPVDLGGKLKVTGAALFGARGTGAFVSRKARLTYGVRGSRRFDHNDADHVCREEVSCFVEYCIFLSFFLAEFSDLFTDRVYTSVFLVLAFMDRPSVLLLGFCFRVSSSP